MTTMNKKIGNCKSRILRNLDPLLKIQRYRNLKFGKESLVYFRSCDLENQTTFSQAV